MSLFSQGYELQHSWTPVGNAEKLSKEELANVQSAVIRTHTLESGDTIRNVVFLLLSGKPVSHKVSPYGSLASAESGEKVNPKSIRLQRFTNEEGEFTITVDGELL